MSNATVYRKMTLYPSEFDKVADAFGVAETDGIDIVIYYDMFNNAVDYVNYEEYSHVEGEDEPLLLITDGELVPYSNPK